MFRSLTLQASFNIFAASILLHFLLPWMTLCSEQLISTVDINSFQLTRESLNSFTAYLTGGLTDPRSVSLPADLFAEALNEELWIKYIIGSVAVLGSVDECALSVIHGLWSGNRSYRLPKLLEELVKKNDCDTVVHFIVRHAGEYFWDTEFGRFIAKLIDSNWDAMRPLLERVLAVLRECEGKSIEYGRILRRLPIEFQYERISSGRVPLDEIDRVYPSDDPPQSLLREIFFQARCSPTPSPAIREYIAERVPWLKQFLSDAPNEFKDTAVTSIVEPGHDVWTRIRGFMDAETLILVWPLVCQTWNKSYSKMLAEDTRIQEWFLRDLRYVDWHKIHTTAPWRHFLNGNNSGLYLGQCILSGVSGKTKLSYRSYREIRGYIGDVVCGKAPIPRTGKGSATHESFAKLIEEGYKAHPHKAPILLKPSFLTDEEHEEVIHHLVCQQKLAVQLSCKWIIDNIPRIYSILGEDQVLIQRVVGLSIEDYRAALPFWIMIGQACGITDDTAKLVFDKPGTFTQKFIRPVVVKPSEYYDHIAESGMLFEMLRDYCEHGWNTRATYQISHLVISLILSFKHRPDKIDKIVASMASQLPTLCECTLGSIKNWIGKKTLNILKRCDEYPSEDVEFFKRVLTQCGLLDESGI